MARDDDTIRLTLDITRESGEAPAGTLTPEHGTPVPFAGWLGLLSALRRACGGDDG